MRARFPFALLVIALLAGCASAGHEYWRTARQTVVIDARSYDVFARRDTVPPRVQVIRRGYARRGEHAAILLAMVQAAEQATGCVVRPGSAVGDSGVMNARLRCPP